MGFTKKQRREQKKHQSERKFYTRKAPKHNPGGSQAIRSVVVKTIWTTPDGEQSPDYDLITVSRTTALDLLQQQIQGEREEHAVGDRSGWKVIVEVFDADHVPDGVLPNDTKFRF